MKLWSWEPVGFFEVDLSILVALCSNSVQSGEDVSLTNRGGWN
jgi:hypothetical protein